jgi:hypothetical protein
MSIYPRIETYEQYWAILFGKDEPDDVVFSEDSLRGIEDIEPFLIRTEQYRLAATAVPSSEKLRAFRAEAAEELEVSMLCDDMAF